MAAKGAIFIVFVKAAVIIIVINCYYAVIHFYALYKSQYFTASPAYDHKLK